MGVFVIRKVGFLLGGGCNGTRNPSRWGYSSNPLLEYFELLIIYPIRVYVSTGHVTVPGLYSYIYVS